MIVAPRTAKKKTPEFIGCYIPPVPPELVLLAARVAIQENPANMPNLDGVFAFSAVALAGRTDAAAESEMPAIPLMIAGVTGKLWKSNVSKLGVYFMDARDPELVRKILHYANLWGQDGRSAVKFVQSSIGNAQIRLARRRGGGHFSYLGTDCLTITQGQQTMNLDSFDVNTDEREWNRVVPHEFGHSLGFPHEHTRADIVRRLDPRRTVDYFQRFQGWGPRQTEQQVLTPIDESDLFDPTPADETSIMAYQLPGSITRDNRPVVGGTTLSDLDREYVIRVYPGTAGPITPPDGGAGNRFALTGVIDMSGAGQLTVNGATLTGTAVPLAN